MKCRLFHLCLIDINHNYFCRPRPGLPVVTHLPNRDTCPNCKDQICILNCPVSRPISHIACPAAVKRILILNQIHCIPVGHNRNIQFFCRRAESLVASGQPDTIACMKYRTFGFADFFQYSADHLIINTWRQL